MVQNGSLTNADGKEERCKNGVALVRCLLGPYMCIYYMFSYFPGPPIVAWIISNGDKRRIYIQIEY